jgi:hypothetical protein
MEIQINPREVLRGWKKEEARLERLHNSTGQARYLDALNRHRAGMRMRARELQWEEALPHDCA